ncbi:MAG: hypothetical protein LWX52_14900 [Deltaproteobacteria bacterium]|jgi:hypothetical protein|nr:hypothetical protein [Deltaproteobacteria bacterium]
MLRNMLRNKQVLPVSALSEARIFPDVHPEPATPGNQSTQFSHQAIREELERILSSPKFAGAGQVRRFLRFAVEETVAGRQNQIKQYHRDRGPGAPSGL